MATLSFKLIRQDENGVKHYVSVTKKQFVSEVTSDSYKPNFILTHNDIGDIDDESYPLDISKLDSEIRYAEQLVEKTKDLDGSYTFKAVTENY